uniref:Rap-GAP domain-containing protein n=1 Tax=Heterorhabditis bacteriophora TaxID=37862 RepID=A0A1I7WFX7_HETBA
MFIHLVIFEVTVESSSLLLINILLSFFHSPYLLQPGDRVTSAISTTFTILRICRDLVAYRTQIPKPLTVRVWSELISRLCNAATRICSHSDRFSQDTSAAFASTVLSNMVVIKAVRRIDIDDRLWDNIHTVFQQGIWIQMSQQWARIARSVTRAMILHIAHLDIFSKEEIEKTLRQRERGDISSMDEGSFDTDVSDDIVFHETDDISSSVTVCLSYLPIEFYLEDVLLRKILLFFLQNNKYFFIFKSWSGDSTTWLLVWRRVMCLLGPHSAANALIAVEAMSYTIQNLLANLDSLAHWLATRLVNSPIHILPNCVAALAAVLSSAKQPPLLLRAHILHAFIRMIQFNEPKVLPYMSVMSPVHLAVLAPHLLLSIPKMISNESPSHDLIKVLALLSMGNPTAEQIVMKQLTTADLSLGQCLMCVNSLTLLIIQRGDMELMTQSFFVLPLYSGILGVMEDPFDALPYANNKLSSTEITPWMMILENSRRQPQPLKPALKEIPKMPSPRLLEWRSFSASMGFVPSVSDVPANFHRDLKHLDQTCAREVHKVAVIYVGDGQEDKQSILSNTSASPEFDSFVQELGWEVAIFLHEMIYNYTNILFDMNSLCN